MCRFALYLGSPIRISSLVTEPEHSIICQSISSREREEPLNGDGFGIGWYAPDITHEPAIFKDITPAWNNANLLHIARVTRSTCILAHIRAATPGLPVTQLNCHPFGWDRFAFMHNGEIGGFQLIRRALLASLSDEAFHTIRGSTDSEHIFGLFIDAWSAATHDDPLERMVIALEQAINVVVRLRDEAGVTTPTTLNLVISDGVRAVASRWVTPQETASNSLYVHSGRAYICEDGVCQMVDPDTVRGAVIIASEPLSTDAGWERVAESHFVTIDEDLVASFRPIG